LACALAHTACREGYSALPVRVPRLSQELETARGDGRYAKLMRTLAKVDVLVADDWVLSPMTDTHRRDWLEVVEDRYARRRHPSIASCTAPTRSIWRVNRFRKRKASNKSTAKPLDQAPPA
jgi:DNA replication protein DnaC